MGFRKITSHSQVCKNTTYLPPAFLLKKMHGLLCLARAAANRITRIVQKRVVMKMSAQPYQNDCLLIILEFVSGEYNREKRYCLPCAYNNFQNQTAAEIKLEFIIHFIHKYVCMRKQIDAAETVR